MLSLNMSLCIFVCVFACKHACTIGQKGFVILFTEFLISKPINVTFCPKHFERCDKAFSVDCRPTFMLTYKKVLSFFSQNFAHRNPYYVTLCPKHSEKCDKTFWPIVGLHACLHTKKFCHSFHRISFIKTHI